MSLAAADLFVVQKAVGGALAKVTAEDLNTFLESTDSVTYKGTADFTANGDDPSPNNTGDLWINSNIVDGAFAWSNPPASGAPTVSQGDRCIWNGATWDVFTDGIQDAGVETVSGGTAITVSGTAADVIVSADYAAEDAIGTVQMAEDDDVENGNVGNPAPLAVSAKQLYDVAQDLEGKIGAAGGGTVTSVSGTAPISVTDGNTTPKIVITVATESAQGSVRLATDAEASAGTATDVADPCAVTPAQLAAELASNVPSDLGVETITEGASGVIAGALTIGGDGADVTIGVTEEVFCPYAFADLPEA